MTRWMEQQVATIEAELRASLAEQIRDLPEPFYPADFGFGHWKDHAHPDALNRAAVLALLEGVCQPHGHLRTSSFGDLAANVRALHDYAHDQWDVGFNAGIAAAAALIEGSDPASPENK